MVFEFDRAVARASSQVARASPTPAMRNATGALATSCESTRTQLGIAGEEPVLLELSFLGVDDGQRAAWSVSGRDGRAVGPADPGKVPSRLDRVDRAASAQRDGDVGARLLDDAG
jgi:hypothetical protein